MRLSTSEMFHPSMYVFTLQNVFKSCVSWFGFLIFVSWIIEWLGLKETLKIILFQIPLLCSGLSGTRLDRPGPYPTWPWRSPRMGYPWFLWAAEPQNIAAGVGHHFIAYPIASPCLLQPRCAPMGCAPAPAPHRKGPFLGSRSGQNKRIWVSEVSKAPIGTFPAAKQGETHITLPRQQGKPFGDSKTRKPMCHPKVAQPPPELPGGPATA